MEADVFAGPQIGGFSIATLLGLVRGVAMCYVEKEVIQLATDGKKEKTHLKVSRHSFPKESKVVIAEDVLNNFSTTRKTIEAIENAGGIVVGIAGLLNRSETVTNEFEYGERKIPVCSLVKMQIKQYAQSDPEVINEIQANNLILNPKKEWETLKAAMEKAEQTV